MEPALIDERSVRRALERLRQGRGLAEIELTGMQALRQRLDRSGRPVTSGTLAAAVDELLGGLIRARLAAARGVPRQADALEPLDRAEAEALLVEDFRAGDARREAWSLLFHRYRSIHAFQMQEIGALVDPTGSVSRRRQLTRRAQLGFTLLARDLREMEEQARLAAVGPPPAGVDGERERRAPALPRYKTSFVGREAAVRAVSARLAEAPLLTLLGIGGVGKTRLAVAVAEAMADDAAGVCFVDLAPLADPTLIPLAVAHALGAVEASSGSPMDAIERSIGSRPLLLVLDNCEHLVDACARLAHRLLTACPSLRILATSRERLDVEAEHVWPVPALSLPEAAAAEAGAPGSVDVPGRDPAAAGAAAAAADAALRRLGESEAVRLFVERATMHDPRFRLTAVNAPAVAELCRRLDGLPLAIELAAARVRHHMPVEIVLHQLDDPLRALATQLGDAPLRQRTLEATLAWSFALLTEAEKQLFARLAVFQNGWTLDAAAAVCSGGLVDRSSMADIIFSLADKSLVVTEVRAGSPRGAYLEVVRHFASRQLPQRHARQVLQQRCADFFLDLAETAEAALTGPEQAVWLERLEAEHDNLHGLLLWLRASHRWELGLRLCGMLWYYWYMHGHIGEGRAYCEGFLDHANDEIDRAVLAKALHAAGTLATYQADYTAALARLEQALVIRRAGGEMPRVASTLSNIATVHFLKGDLGTARELYRQSLDIYRQADIPPSVANILNNLTEIALLQGDLAMAECLLAESLGMACASGDSGSEATALANLARVAHLRGDVEAARRRFAECSTIAESLGDIRVMQRIAREISEMERDLGALAAARRHLDRALDLCHQLDDGWVVCETLCVSGGVLLDEGEWAAAEAAFHQSLDLARHIDHRFGVTAALRGLAQLACAAGRPADAGRLLAESLNIGRQVDAWHGDILGLEVAIDLAAETGLPERVVKLAAAAAGLRARFGAPAPPPLRAHLDRRLACAREALGADAAQRLWQAASGLSHDEAIDLALHGL